MKVALVFGGRSVEHRVSIASARTIAAGLTAAGHTVVPIGIAQSGHWVDRAASEAAIAGRLETLPAMEGSIAASVGNLLAAEVDVVFPIVHGTWGEDGTLQGLCEMLDLPYAGADVTSSSIAMDKLQCKRLLRSCGVPIVDFEAVTAAEMEDSPQECLHRLQRLAVPLFVKPSCGGSSVGVTRVTERRAIGAALGFALRFDDVVVVELEVAGRELECSVLGDATLEASAVGEVVPGNEFYDYADKYLLDAAVLEIPARLPEALAERVRELAVQAFSVLGGSGMARVDFLLGRDGSLYVNEINTLPGFTRISMYPKLWRESGLPLDRLVDRLLDIALARHRRRRGLDQGIKDWIAEIGS